MDYRNWFVLHVTTGKEQQLKNLIERNSDEPLNTVLFSSQLSFKRKGTYRKVNCPLFPGYLFVYKNPKLAIETIKKRLKNEFIRPVCLKHIKCLHCFTSHSPCMVLPEEMEVLLKNSDISGLFRVSYGFKIGDGIVITEGPLKNLRGRILHINEKKKVVQVELFLFRRKMRAYLGIELLKK